MLINSNHCNVAFDREIDNCNDWLKTKVTDACGYSSSTLRDRLLQRVVEIGLCPYVRAVKASGDTKSRSFPVSGMEIDCREAFLEMGSGRISFAIKQWLRGIFGFLLHWVFCFFVIISVSKNNKSKLPAVLIYGVGEDVVFASGDDSQFINFCRKGPIATFRTGRKLLVEYVSSGASSSSDDFSYSRRPHISLIRQVPIGVFGRIHLLAKHGRLFFGYFNAVWSCPSLLLLGRDFAYSAIFQELDRNRLIESVVLTCSNYISQPLWFRALKHAKVHMIWYAQNWRPIGYRDDGVTSNVPSLRWLRVDTHWVWTKAFAEYLEALIPGADTKVVGPIVWSLPADTPTKIDALEIVIFDVSPFDDEVALKGGEISNYFNSENLFTFVENLIILKAELEGALSSRVRLRLKTKRGLKAVYDSKYFEYLEKLNAAGIITLEHHSVNIYSLIASSDLVISYPFTSTAYIADYLGIPSIYYDPTGAILRQDFCDSNSLVAFAGSQSELYGISATIFRGVLADRNGISV